MTQIRFDRFGNPCLLDNDEVVTDLSAALGGAVVKRRVSHVEPVNPAIRWLFQAIRSRVSDGGWLAAFTRCWPVRWQARIIEGPTLGPFWSRQAAIDAEIDHMSKETSDDWNTRMATTHGILGVPGATS